MLTHNKYNKALMMKTLAAQHKISTTDIATFDRQWHKRKMGRKGKVRRRRSKGKFPIMVDD